MTRWEQGRRDAMRAWELETLDRELRRSRGDVHAVAEYLGLTPGRVRRLAARQGLDPAAIAAQARALDEYLERQQKALQAARVAAAVQQVRGRKQ